jgi:hypothetical protein
MRWLPTLAVGLLVTMVAVGHGLAQTTAPLDRVLVTNDGALWLVRDGQRHALRPLEVSVDKLDAWPEGLAFGSEIPARVHEVFVERMISPTPVPTAPPPTATATAVAISTVVAATPPSASAQADWRRVGQWQGNGDKNTETFQVISRRWRIAFTVRDPRSGTPHLCIAVRTLEGARVEGGCYRRDDTTYIYTDPGNYYLDINSADQWTVLVEELP